MKDSVKGLCIMQWFHFEKDQPYKFLYNNIINEEISFSVSSLQKSRQVGRLTKDIHYHHNGAAAEVGPRPPHQ
jgi:hypothetical protein